MKIALIARGCQPGSGIELYTFELAKRLIRNHQVSVLTDPDNYCSCGATLVPIKVNSALKSYSISKFSQLAGQKAKEGNYDIVHTQGSDGNWGDVVTAHSSHWAGMRASLKIDPSLSNRMRKLLSLAHKSVLIKEKQALHSARKILAVSHRVARQLKATYPILKNTKFDVVYPGCEFVSYPKKWITEQRQKIRASYQLTEENIIFALVANDPFLKGAARVIPALASCQNKKAHLLIASLSDHQPVLKKQAISFGVQDQVHFAKMKNDATAAYLAADIYIGLPEYESFGITYLEAMSFNKPVLTTTNSGVAELIKKEGGGILIPSLSRPDKIAKVMNRLIGDHTLRKHLAKEASVLASHYQWDGMVNKIEKVYENLLQKKLSVGA